MKLGGIAKTKALRRWRLPDFKSWDKKKKKKALLYGIGGFVLFIVLLFAWNAKDLPTPSKLAKLHATESTKILDRNGAVLYETGEERRTVLDRNQIPDSVKNATIAGEDANFYHHGGVDFRGVLRAASADILHLKISQGGSTITQQFVKNALLTNKRTFSRKIKELILSLEIEQLYSKDDILAMYLNEIPYGGNVYGIEEASNMYFGKSAKEVTLSEAATLAAIPRAPTYYSPYGTHTDRLFIRKDYILDRMAELGYITADEAKAAKEDAPNPSKLTFKQKRESITAPHFVMYVKEKLVEQYGERLVNSGGMTVTTSLDIDKQKKAEEAIAENEKKLGRYNATNAALVSVDVKTGEILAMVGGKDYFDIEHGGNVNVTDSARQPGSSFKPVVYATAFKQARFSPGFNLFDLKTDFSGYEPDNYDGSTHGAITMRRALANSLNIPAVKTLALVGLPEALKTAEDMGITTLNTPDRYGLSLVLGGGEVKPIEMAGAFAAFGDNGTFHQPTTILKVQDNKGKTLSEYKPEENSFQALDPQIAYEISNILDDDDARCMVFGCDNPLNFGDVHVAAKTGTTQEFHDAWTNGYTTKIATSVWVGNNDNTKMTNGADGIVVAAPIFHDYMANFATEDDFVRPSGIQDLSVEKYSSKLPTQYSKEYTKDIFASWQVPTERDDINVVLKVNKINGRLATDNTPLELIEERLFTNLHNEWGKLWKDYPNWEGPVRSWAIGHGMNLAPPSEDDDSYNGRPSISFSNPTSGATLTGEVVLRVSVGSDQKIDNVTYYLGDTQIASSTGAPYAASFNSSSYPNGAYKLTAKVTDVNGVSEQNSIDVTVQNESAPRISNLSVSGITTNTATISFLTDISSSTKVDFGLSAGNLDQSKQINTGGTSHSTIISGLSSGKKYYFRVTATNSKGTSSSAEGNFTTL